MPSSDDLNDESASPAKPNDEPIWLKLFNKSFNSSKTAEYAKQLYKKVNDNPDPFDDYLHELSSQLYEDFQTRSPNPDISEEQALTDYLERQIPFIHATTQQGYRDAFIIELMRRINLEKAQHISDALIEDFKLARVETPKPLESVVSPSPSPARGHASTDYGQPAAHIQPDRFHDDIHVDHSQDNSANLPQPVPTKNDSYWSSLTTGEKALWIGFMILMTPIFTGITLAIVSHLYQQEKQSTAKAISGLATASQTKATHLAAASVASAADNKLSSAKSEPTPLPAKSAPSSTPLASNRPSPKKSQ